MPGEIKPTKSNEVAVAPMSKPLAIARLFLGLAQTTGAATGMVLLLNSGITRATLVVCGATTCLTILSRVLFRGR